MTTSTLSSLKVIARPKIEPKPPVLGKRLKLIEKLEQQKEMAQCLIDNKRFEAFKQKRIKDSETGEVIGTTAIEAAVGLSVPLP